MTAVFLKLLNMSIAAGWLVLVIMVLRLILKKAPKAIYCILWGLVGIRLVCPFTIESIFSLLPSGETVPEEIVYAVEPTIQSGVTILNSYVNPIISEGLAPTGKTGATPMQTVLFTASVIWLTGMVIMGCYGMISYLRLHKRTREHIRFDINSDENGDFCTKYEKDIRLCDQISTPFILGMFRPCIFLPSDISREDALYVIAHERAHLKRRDHWWKPIGFVLLTIYWFNPLIWAAYILLCRDIELACDEKVIRDMGTESKKPYLESLINCSSSERMISACPLAFGEVDVERRVKNVLHYKKPGFWLVAAAVLACVAAAVCFLTDPHKQSEEPDLSFLNYHNAVARAAYMEEVTAIHYTVTDKNGNAGIQIGATDGNSLAQYLGSLSWKACRENKKRLSSPGSLEFVLEDDYRITIYKRKPGDLFAYAVVRYGDEKRYYRAGYKDYEEAVALCKAANIVKEEVNAEVTVPFWDNTVGLKVKEIVYVCRESPELFMPRIRLSLEDNSFTFSYAMFSSSFSPGGTFEMTDSELVLREKSDWPSSGSGYTAAKKYVFTREGDHYLFDAEQSSLMPKYQYSAGTAAESPVVDGSVFEPIMLRFSPEENYVFIIDSIMADIDSDGVDEICTLSYGPTSGLFTVVLSVKEYGKEELEYFNIYNSPSYDFSFMVDGTGKFYLQGIAQGEKTATHLFELRFQEGNIVLYKDGTEEALEYWGEQGTDSEWVNQ